MRANNIKQVRERLGLSQVGFAEAIGVSQGNISHYECQRQDVSPDVARRVIAAAQERGVHITFDDIYAVEADISEGGIKHRPGTVRRRKTEDRRHADRRGTKGAA